MQNYIGLFEFAFSADEQGGQGTCGGGPLFALDFSGLSPKPNHRNGLQSTPWRHLKKP
jgi:hypothetical protein